MIPSLVAVGCQNLLRGLNLSSMVNLCTLIDVFGILTVRDYAVHSMDS
jgi:hypothetical protein